MPFDADAFDQVRLRLTKISNIANSPMVEQAMKAAAQELQQTARDMAPIDYGDLKDAIQVARRGGARNAKGQFFKGGGSSYTIYLNNRHPVRESERKGIETVGEYAWHVHEHMGWGSNDTGFMPSERSVAEGRKAGVEAGGKFLDRAAIKLGGSIYRRISEVVLKQVEALDGLD